MTRGTTLSLILLVAAAGTAAQTRRPLSLDDMSAMKRVSAPAVAPDGKRVAYTLTRAILEENKTASDVYVSPVDGGAAVQLTNHPAADRNPVWSPDGKWIAFESARSGTGQIWLVSADGGEPRQFTTLSTGASNALWSPDGKSIGYVSEVFPEYSALPFRVSDSLNRARQELLDKGPVKAKLITGLLYRHWDSWRDGKRKQVFVQPVAGGEPRNVTPLERDGVPSSATFSEGTDFAFSPDGKELAYTASPLPVREEAWSTDFNIFVVPLSGGTPKQITTNPAADGYPQYSPDGKSIAYRAQRRPGFEADRWEIMLYDRATGKTRSLTESHDISFGAQTWAPDSRALYADAGERARTPIFAIDLKGNVRKMVEGGSNSSLTLSKDGSRLVFLRATMLRPAEIYTAGRDGAARQVTRWNDDLFAGIDTPAPEEILYEGAGGTPNHMWILKPPGFNASGKYPLVMLVHGGPQGAWADSWSYRWNPALWAAQGYVIALPNPRGSTGFGQAFTDGVSGDWGGKVFIDLIRGLDELEKLPFVDRTRVAAAGASFGGFMTNWFAGNAGDRFKTLVTHCGIYNAVSMYGATEEVWFDEWEKGGTPWDRPEEYAKHSPHTYAKNFRTPMLIIHGEKDYRIPVTEAFQIFTALQRQGVPSKFLYFPDEGHWVLKPANSRFWHETVFGWLAEYLR